MLETNGTELCLEPGNRQRLGSLLALYPCTLNSAAIEADGTLRLGFDNNATLTVPPDAHYEVWQINGPGTALIVCMPGDRGTLAIWD